MSQTTDLEGRKTFDFLDTFCGEVRFLSETVSTVLNFLIKHQKVHYRDVGRSKRWGVEGIFVSSCIPTWRLAQKSL